MFLDELRIVAKNKAEELDNNANEKEANKKFAKTIIKILGNTDYIIESPKSLIYQILFFLGYDPSKLENLYKELIDEITKTYKVISVEQLSENIDKNK